MGSVNFAINYEVQKYDKHPAIFVLCFFYKPDNSRIIESDAKSSE